MNTTMYTIEPIGYVRSELRRLEDAPMQGDEGAPEAWLELTPQALPGLMGITVGDDLLILHGCILQSAMCFKCIRAAI